MAALVVCVVAALWVARSLRAGWAPVGEGETRIVEIPRGAGVVRIASLLHDEGLIRDERAFRVGVGLWDLADQLKAGHYELSPEMSPREIAETIASGKTATVTITIPEGYTVAQVAEVVAEAELCSAADFLESAVPAAVSDLDVPIEAESLEGFLFPATYEVEVGSEPRDLVRNMVRTFRRRIIEGMAAQLRDSSRPVHEVVTIASMVEREARVARDRPLISSVIRNRLQRGMRLDIDATVIYALGSHTTTLTARDLRIDSPFNTRRYKGLPPHAICSPGEASIRAALNPTKTDYLFYVARADGSHVFTRSNAEHERAKAAIREGRP